MIKFIWSVILISTVVILHGESVADAYIYKYKDIAISEMARTGIPASIKLAQGLLESDWGRSELAKKANNHFGIKCGGIWDGDGYYIEDDDTDGNGKIIPSCFRVFGSSEESYIAHSEFLTSEDRSGRYAFLFDYNITDYKSWAEGLKKAGYATDRKYPSKLISIIEKYQLYQFDLADDQYDASTEIVNENRSSKRSNTSSRLRNKPAFENSYTVGSYSFATINKVRMTTAIGGETLEELAARVGSDVEDLIDYNESFGYRTVVLKEGDIVYLEKKKRSYKGELEYHLFVEGETMFSISQLYGIKLDNLYAKNKMPKGAEPLPGARLYLKKTAPKDDRPPYTKHPFRGEEIEFLFADGEASK